jgi:hypothetical protein
MVAPHQAVKAVMAKLGLIPQPFRFVECEGDLGTPLAEISNDWNELVSVITQWDEHIDRLYSDGIRLAEAVKQQADQIKNLDSSVNRLAEAILVIENKSQSSIAARLGGVFYWLSGGLAVILLIGGAWFFYEVFKNQTREAVAWILPIAVVILA